jgi:energy-coupling factor transport system ATP-binding protein
MLRDLIRKWKEAGKTIIAAEHRIAYLWDLIDRAVILRDGQILKELSGQEKDTFTIKDLREMGLRSTVLEDPSQMSLPMAEEDESYIFLKDFHFTYKGEKREIVNIPSMSFARGRITAIVGGNGAGKTSLLNCICGLEKRCRGTLTYNGKTYGAKDRKKLAFMVMQDTGNQLFTESVLEEVLISLPKAGEKTGEENEREEALSILRDLDLEAFQDRHPQSLSGGQKQRLAIACAIASGREILLLDEPTSGLDFDHMEETAVLLKKLQSRGTTILVVTHDCELIRTCCDRIVRV